MGPSGAGKTTFMNALSGRATYGRTTGKIYINGLPNNVANLSNLVGFVPQEDVMHRELTVRETLKSYALLRLPNYFPYMSVERVVSDVIEALQLDQVSDSIIGDEKTRGISGGQRKRVNVAMGECSRAVTVAAALTVNRCCGQSSCPSPPSSSWTSPPPDSTRRPRCT